MASTPTKTDESNAAKIARGLVAGMIAGAVASFAMDRFQAMAAPLLPSSGDSSKPATEKAADAVATQVTGHAVPAADKPLAGQAVHYAVGIALGCRIRSRGGVPPFGHRGLGYGVRARRRDDPG